MSDASNEPQEKKLHIDDDWKSQVEAEKEAARRAAEHPSAGEPSGASEAAPGELPPASLSMLAGSLYLQSMIGLGLMPNPMAEQGEHQKPNLAHARHSIDMLEMLYEKTQGNRTPEETEEMERMLHDLRMAFVSVQQNIAKPAGDS
jgi:hypothetical protein